MLKMTDAQFDKISDFVKNMCGINLHDGKKELVKARLSKRLRKLGIRNFDKYFALIRDDTTGTELTLMLDALSTNLTSFFREASHFDYLAQNILSPMASNARNYGKKIRLWSAGCSSGEEPYCMAIVLREIVKDLNSWDAKVLATDLSTRVLDKASQGIYSQDRMKTVSPQIRHKYFDCIETRPEKKYRVSNDLRSLLSFARLNLMTPWPMKGPFDAIFCRNVMIYFDKPTQAKLVNRYWEMLRPGGTLFIGHSESLTGIEHKFKYVQPTVYEKS